MISACNHGVYLIYLYKLCFGCLLATFPYCNFLSAAAVVQILCKFPRLFPASMPATRFPRRQRVWVDWWIAWQMPSSVCSLNARWGKEWKKMYLTGVLAIFYWMIISSRNGLKGTRKHWVIHSTKQKQVELGMRDMFCVKPAPLRHLFVLHAPFHINIYIRAQRHCPFRKVAGKMFCKDIHI